MHLLQQLCKKERVSMGGKNMVKKKDKTVVARIVGLTDTQTAQMMAEIIKSKQKYAPDSRGTIATGKEGEILSLKQKKRKRLSGKKSKRRTESE